MAELYNVFISWSGDRSKAAGEALKKWLPLVVPAANPWMSQTEIDKGARWQEELGEALDTIKSGITCLTPENPSAPWLLFEAGALSKRLDPKTRLWTYFLAGMAITDLPTAHPLSIFQATKAEKEDTRKLIHSINRNLDRAEADETVNSRFDKFWDDLKQKLDAIPAPPGPAPAKRTADEMIEETLELLRALTEPILETNTYTGEAHKRRLADDEAWRTMAQSPPGSIGYYATRAIVPRPSLAGRGSLHLDLQDAINAPDSGTHAQPAHSPAEATPHNANAEPPQAKKAHMFGARKHVSPRPKPKP